MNEAIIITDPLKIELTQWLVIASGLKLELHGMRHSSNAVFLKAKQLTGEKTRKACLEKMEKMIYERKVKLGLAEVKI